MHRGFCILVMLYLGSCFCALVILDKDHFHSSNFTSLPCQSLIDAELVSSTKSRSLAGLPRIFHPLILVGLMLEVSQDILFILALLSREVTYCYNISYLSVPLWPSYLARWFWAISNTMGVTTPLIDSLCGANASRIVHQQWHRLSSLEQVHGAVHAL